MRLQVLPLPIWRWFLWLLGRLFWAKVYVFGLSKINRSQNSVAKKLSLTKSRWKALAAPPADVDECLCVFYRHSILIAGDKKDKIYQYNIDLDSYSEIEGLACNHYKLIMFVAELRAYAIEFEGNIIESGTIEELLENLFYQSIIKFFE
ncbi:unnamed protein product [Blepharisma stoltei]|uniref:Uncharacterized protein n=1 Tax=Blepharisma stoltei TaxID=1481888 RepID=A0AAU9K206_9CILI|nr:unnamed protein product [Blepharisma stoltei]